MTREVSHLSRFKRMENLGVMLLTHHLNGCYEYQRTMMFNMMITDPSKVTEMERFGFCWHESIKISAFLLFRFRSRKAFKKCISFHSRNAFPLYCFASAAV